MVVAEDKAKGRVRLNVKRPPLAIWRVRIWNRGRIAVADIRSGLLEHTYPADIDSRRL